MLKSSIKNSLLFVMVFFTVSIVLKELIDYLEKEDISKIGSRLSRIENFTLYSTGKNSYKMNGSYIVDYGSKVYINNPNIVIQTSDDRNIYITSKEAFYYPNKNLINFFSDVSVKSTDVELSTSSLRILVKDLIAYNTDNNTIISKNMKIEGRNLLFYINKQNFSLDNVKTQIRGKDG